LSPLAASRRSSCVLTAVMTACLLGPACAENDVSREDTAQEPVIVTPDDLHRPVDLEVGQQLIVRLPSNPTTGYRWSLAAPVTGVLKLDGAAGFEPSPSGRGLVGAPGHEVWRFRAMKRGQGTVRFEYRRSWEKDVPPTRALSFTATVK
jgi:inhibitor of cysteine peptidase